MPLLVEVEEERYSGPYANTGMPIDLARSFSSQGKLSRGNHCLHGAGFQFRGRSALPPHQVHNKSQAYFWTRKWQEGERAAGEDIRRGRVKTFDSVDGLIKELDRQ